MQIVWTIKLFTLYATHSGWWEEDRYKLLCMYPQVFWKNTRRTKKVRVHWVLGVRELWRPKLVSVWLYKGYEKKRKYSKWPTSQRQYSRMYYVINGAISEQVCKKAFLSIHGVSHGRMERAIQAQVKKGGSPHTDQRGQHIFGNKTSDDDIELIKQHISSFPRYQSHYSRQDNPNRKYLSPTLSVAKMYTMYQEKCQEERRATICSEFIYRTFNKAFNLSFGL